MNPKLRKYLTTLALLLFLGFSYLVFIRITGICLPCLFEKCTGWLCPGCGITTLFYRLSKFNFSGAYRANPFLFITFPFIIFEIVFDLVNKIKGKTSPKWNNILLYIYIAGLLAFCLWRNIYGQRPFLLFQKIKAAYFFVRDLAVSWGNRTLN